MAYYDKERNLSEIQGRLHEDAAAKKFGGDIVNLNDISGTDKFRTYDLISSEGIYSVKSHISESGEMKEWVKSAYMEDFDKLNGWTWSDSAQKDAQALNNLPKSVPLPPAFKGKSPEEQVNYLKNNSILCIPEDHVQVMRDHLRGKATEFPENYQLPENYTEEQMETLTQRIQGTGLTSSETKEMLNKLEQESTVTDKPENATDQALDEEEDKGYYNDYTI